MALAPTSRPLAALLGLAGVVALVGLAEVAPRLARFLGRLGSTLVSVLPARSVSLNVRVARLKELGLQGLVARRRRGSTAGLRRKGHFYVFLITGLRLAGLRRKGHFCVFLIRGLRLAGLRLDRTLAQTEGRMVQILTLRG